MGRAFCIPGIIFLFIALVLSFLSGVHVEHDGITEIRFGVWAACEYDVDQARTCGKAGHGYTVGVADPKDTSLGVIIGPSWTRGLAVHPVATAVTFVAFLLSFSTHLTVTLLASIVAFLAAAITLIAFAIDIALYAFVKHQFEKLPDVKPNTVTGPGFWLTFVTLILLLLAGCTVCFGRRRDRNSTSGSTSYPMTSTKKPIWARFRKN